MNCELYGIGGISVNGQHAGHSLRDLVRFRVLYLEIKDVGQSALTKRNDKQASLMWTD